MAEIVTMPKLGFDMAEGTLVRWVVAEGEQVTKGAVLAEIETDKATVEVESGHEGILVRQLVTEGTPVPVGDPIAVVGAEGEEVDVDKLMGEIAPEAETGLRPGAPEEDAEALPRPSETEEAREQAPAAQAEPEAAPTAPPPSPPATPPATPPAQAQMGIAAAEAPKRDGPVRASPLARRFAEEKGIDLAQVEGTGPRGRISRADVEAFLERLQPAARPAAPEAPAPAPAPERAPAQKPVVPLAGFGTFEAAPADERIPLNRLRGAIGRRMVEAKQQIPHFYVTHEYNMAPLMDLRKQANNLVPDEEKISVNDFIVKAVGLALRRFPNLNASLQGNEVVRFGQVNVGVAVAVEGGLLTVVARDADRKPVRQISAELRTMIGRVREGKVRPDDIEGSTFSVSNMGMFDVEHFIAIINPPEAAILAVGSALEVPVVDNGEIKIGLRMKATLSVDHRVSDGAEGARFMQALGDYIEEPMRLLL